MNQTNGESYSKNYYNVDIYLKTPMCLYNRFNFDTHIFIYNFKAI